MAHDERIIKHCKYFNEGYCRQGLNYSIWCSENNKDCYFMQLQKANEQIQMLKKERNKALYRVKLVRDYCKSRYTLTKKELEQRVFKSDFFNNMFERFEKSLKEE